MANLIGRVAAVNTVPLGGILDVDAPAGSTVLFLEDTADFSEDGGFGNLIGGSGVEDATELVTYLSADDDMGQLALSAPTVTGFLAGDRIDLWDPSTGSPVVETRAQVLVDGSEQGGDPVEAVVDHTMVPYLPEGIRAVDPVTGVTGESVALEWRGEELYVVNISGRVPVMDGGMIDPDTLPPSGGGPVPEVPVTPAAPNILGGVASLLVRWEAVLHPNPVVYEVHVSDVTPVVPSAETLIGQVSGTALTVRSLPKESVDGAPETALNYETVYYAAIIAKDSTDESYESGLSPEGSGTPVQINSPDIAARSVAAENIQVGSLVGELLAGEVLLGSNIKTATSGQRVEMDPNGIRLHGPDDDVLIDLPTAPGAEPTFRGAVQADGLTVRQGAAFYSPWNEFARDSVINLAEQVAGPVAGPTATVGWEGVPLEIKSYSGDLGTFALVPSEIIGVGRDFRTSEPRITIMQRRPNGTRVWYYDMNGSLSPLSPAPLWDWVDWTVTGVHYEGAAPRVFAKWHENGDWYFYTNVGGGSYSYNHYPTIAEGLIPMSFDGTYYVTAEKWDTNRYRFRRVDPSTSPVTIVENVYTDSANSSRPSELCFVHRGTADWGTTKWTVAHTDAHYRPFSATGTYDVDNVFLAASTKGGGFYDTATGRFYTVGTNGVLYKHSSLKWTDPALSTWHVGQSFTDTNATGGTHETALGAVTSFTMQPRAQVRFTLADVPYAGGSDDPNGWKVYAKRGSAPLADRSDMKFQGSGSYLNKTFLMSSAPLTTGASALQFGTFPGASPARMRSGRTFATDATKAVFEVRGDGSGHWGTLEVDSSGVLFLRQATLPRLEHYKSGTQAVPSSLGPLTDPVEVSLVLPRPAFCEVSISGLFGVGGGSASDGGALVARISGAYTETPTTGLTRALRGSNQASVSGGSINRFYEFPAGTTRIEVWGTGNATVRHVALNVHALYWM